MIELLLACALLSFVNASVDADASELAKVSIPFWIELICGACLIACGLYLNYFGRSVFKVFVALTGAALGAHSCVLITCAVASGLGVRKDPVALYVLLGILGAMLGSLLLRRLWRFATVAMGAFAGKAAVLLAFTVVPEAAYLDSVVRLVFLFLGGLVGGVLAMRLERHAVIVATAIFGTFLALFGYDIIRHLSLAEHFKMLVSLDTATRRLEYLHSMTESEELKGVLIFSVFVIVTGIYIQYRITPKHIDRD